MLRPPDDQGVYVSGASGDDGFIGTSTSPWKTLARVGQTAFGPGSFINLNRGESWHETFVPNGNGVKDTGWITVRGYGTGANPVIDGDGVRNYGVRFDNLLHTGGWQFDGIDVRRCLVGGYVCESAAVQMPDGLLVQNCSVTDVTGTAYTGQFLTADSNAVWPTGILLTRVKNATFRNVSVNNCDVGTYAYSVVNMTLDTCSLVHCGTAAGSFHQMSNAGAYPVGGQATRERVSNTQVLQCTVADCSWMSKPDGHVSLFFLNADNTLIQGGSISQTRKPFNEPDGCAIDLEGGCNNTTIDSVLFEDGEGVPILHAFNLFVFSPTPGQNSGTVIKRCTLRRNGTWNTTLLAAWIRSNCTTDPVQLTNNDVTLGTNQKLFSKLAAGDGNTNVPPPTPGVAWYFPLTGPDANVVH